MRRRAAFLQYLAVVVALAIAVFFAGWFGLLARVWSSDASHMSSVVAALTLATVIYIGVLTWHVPDGEWFHGFHERMRSLEDHQEWCGTAADLSPALGLIGTIFGLAEQAMALREGGDVLALLGTALFSTMSGVTGFAVILVLSHVLSSSLKRARRNAS